MILVLPPPPPPPLLCCQCSQGTPPFFFVMQVLWSTVFSLSCNMLVLVLFEIVGVLGSG